VITIVHQSGSNYASEFAELRFILVSAITFTESMSKDNLTRRAFVGSSIALGSAFGIGVPLTLAQSDQPAPPPSSPTDAILLTIFLKHDQSKTLTEIQADLKASSFWKTFPPEGIEVASWYIMMGIGQVVTLRVPPARLREVNLAIERTAWKAFRTEFYTTYDYTQIAQEQMQKERGS
jgi:hypothetical protein